MGCSKLHKLQYLRPEVWIERWDCFVKDLETGYNDVSEEFYNDLEIIRAPIEHFLDNADLQQFTVHVDFINQIKETDNRYIDASFEDVQLPKDIFKWWSRRILTKGSLEYAESFDESIRKQIEIVT